MKILSLTSSLLLTSSAIVAIAQFPNQAVPVLPLGNQKINQQTGTTLWVKSLNSQLTVSAATGADISEPVAAALGTVASTCGTVTIAPGSYIWSGAKIKMLPCETLQGTGATVSITVAGASPFLVVKVPTVPNPLLTIGGIRGITFVGPAAPTSRSSSTGIQLGGMTSAESAQLFNLYDVHVRNFGCGLSIQFAHQIAFFGGSIEANYDGICFANIITGLENLNFHGTQILNNIDYGIDDDQTGLFVELSLTDCSLDYNGQFRSTGGEIQITNGKLNITGSHLENNTLPLITIRAPGAPASVDVYIAGTAFNMVDTNPKRTSRAFIGVKGLGDVVEMGRGVSFYSQGAPVEAAVEWAPIYNGNGKLLMDPYTYSVGTADRGLPAYVGLTPHSYSYALYDRNGDITGIASSFPYRRQVRPPVTGGEFPR